MRLDEFKGLVDAQSTATQFAAAGTPEILLADIRSCFTVYRATARFPKQGKLDELHAFFAKLKAAADRAQEPYLGTPFPFERSWSLSVYHLLMLLDRTTDSESFSRELRRTRRVVTPLKDYPEYAFVLGLGHATVPSQAPSPAAAHPVRRWLAVRQVCALKS